MGRLETRTAIVVLFMLSTLFGLGGCGEQPDAQPSTPTPDPVAAPTHAPAGVKPGSHDDWCTEHAVPESLCTRCNPSLIAAFQATGDWCPEHGLPESQCLVCNPNTKIERPPAEASP